MHTFCRYIWHLITLLLFRLEALKSSNEDLDEFMSSREQGFINRYNLISRTSGNTRGFQVRQLIFCQIVVKYSKVDCYFTVNIWMQDMNARFECNDIVIFIYSHYLLDPIAKLSDTKCFNLSIRWFCIRIER